VVNRSLKKELYLKNIVLMERKAYIDFEVGGLAGEEDFWLKNKFLKTTLDRCVFFVSLKYFRMELDFSLVISCPSICYI